MIFENIKKASSLKKLVIIAAIFIIVQQSLSSFVAAWSAEAGVTFMDFIFGGYETDTVYHVLNAIGASGRHTYVCLLVLDCLMGILYLLVLLCLIGLLLKKYLNDSKKCNWLLLCPIIAMLSDWIENLMTFCHIQNFPDISPVLTVVESTCTTLKFSFIGISVTIAVVIAIYGICKNLYKSKNVQQTH